MNPFQCLFYRLLKKFKLYYKPINESESYQKSLDTGGVVIKLNGNTDVSLKMACYTIFLFIACCFVISFCNLPVLPLEPDVSKFPFRNPSLPLHIRVDDLVQRLVPNNYKVHLVQ